MSSKSSILSFFLVAIYLVINFVNGNDTPYEKAEYDTATILITSTKPPTVHGTKWCGHDTAARSHDDLGDAVETDKCCREWHNCDEFIGPHGQKYGIHNPANYKILLCRCNEQFHQCLRDVNGMEAPTATQIGIAYFDVISPKCLKKMYYAPTCEVPYYDTLGNQYTTNGGSEYFCPQLSASQFWYQRHY